MYCVITIKNMNYLKLFHCVVKISVCDPEYEENIRKLCKI